MGTSKGSAGRGWEDWGEGTSIKAAAPDGARAMGQALLGPHGERDAAPWHQSTGKLERGGGGEGRCRAQKGGVLTDGDTETQEALSSHRETGQRQGPRPYMWAQK